MKIFIKLSHRMVTEKVVVLYSVVYGVVLFSSLTHLESTYSAMHHFAILLTILHISHPQCFP